jgi:porin
MPGFPRRQTNWLRVLGALAVLLAACAEASAQAVEQGADRIPGLPEPSVATSLPPAIADPGGVRAAFGRRGITFGVNYIGEVFGNPSGGYAKGAFYDGRLEIAVAADLSKTVGWPGLSFFANGYQIHGESISAADLGALMPASFIEADPATRLFELWLDQKLYGGKVSIRFGQLAADSEFMLSQGGQTFLNGTWGWPSIAALNLPQNGPAYPLATPGVRLALNPTDDFGMLVGAFNGNPAGDCAAEQDPQECNPNGLMFPLDAPPLVMAEAAFKHDQGEGELAGTIKLGAYQNFGTFRHQRVITGGVRLNFTREPPREIDGDWGGYIVVDQMLYRLPGSGDPKGIAAFARVVGAPANRNPVDVYWEAGLTFSGMVASRPDDTFGIGYAYTGISRDITERQKDHDRPIVASYESVLEMSYIAQIMPGLILQPDFQYFWNPGGHVPDRADPRIAVPNAAVVGLRTTINY